MVSLKLVLSLPLAALLAQAPASLAGAPIDPREVARAHYARGLDLAGHEAYEAALAEFKEAYRIRPHFAVLYNIGQAELALGRSLEAMEDLSRYLREGQQQVPDDRRKEVWAQIAQLEARFGGLTITTDRPGALISVDDREVGRTPLFQPIRLAAGIHKISATVVGGPTVIRTISIKQGERQLLTLEMRTASVAAPEDDNSASPPSRDRSARGGLDKEAIRRVIRRHLDDVRRCYMTELAVKPALFGRILVQFTISPSGQVTESRLLETTMGDPRTEACTVLAPRGWQFPPPLSGGAVVTSYPFILIPTTGFSIAGERNGAGSVEIEPLTSRLVVHRSRDAHGIPSNGLVAVTEAGLLLVDTAWNEKETEAILRWGAERFALPWIGAVITHDHPDRDGGLGALFRRGIPVAALDLTVGKLAQRGIHGVTTWFDAQVGEKKDTRGFEAFYPGPGHTSDNIVIAFPEADVLFGGCLIRSAVDKDLGFTGDADLGAWPTSLRRVAKKYNLTRIVPGHGAVDSGDAAFRNTLDLLRSGAKAK